MKNLIMVGASAKWVVDITDFSNTSAREVAVVIASYIKDKN